MKVGDTGNEKKIREQELLARNSNVAARGGSAEKRIRPQDGDSRVNLGVGQEISQQLNPTAIAAARRQRVEELKELVKNNNYRPPLMEVAARVAEELDAEIFSMKGRISEDEESV